MSRGIRDLRDLICVSRLTVRHSDEEIFSSDDERLGNFSQRFDRISLSSNDPSREGSAASRKDLHSPDSGIATNGNSPQESTENGVTSKVKNVTAGHAPHPPNGASSQEIPRAYRKKKRKKKKFVETEISRHELPKMSPLPPVTKSTHSRPSSSSSESCSSRSELVSPKVLNHQRNMPMHVTTKKEGNYDELLTFLDATLVGEWLQTSNRNVTDMATWCHAGENFVRFAHFWLSQFPDIQKHEIFKLEHSIVVDSLSFAFAAGRDSGQLKHRDLVDFLKAVFREYPEKLLSTKGNYLFLDHLDVLSSERQESYRTLLSDVKCSTRIKQHAQWILAIRSFTLVSIWIAVLNFYRRLVVDTGATKDLADPIPLAAVNKNDPHQVRMYHAVRNGYTDVVQYLVKSGKVDPLSKDLHQKNLLFTAVMLNQPRVLRFILNNIRPCPAVNEAADTGNTPLHAAANSGNAEVVDILLGAHGINVNITNPQCENATPLHLAVMHGHTKVIEQLLKAGADAEMKMGDLTPLSIATDFDREEIASILKTHLLKKGR